MNYSSMNKTSTYVELTEGNNKMFIPTDKAIIVDDESGLLSIKTNGSRKTVATVKKNDL